MPGASPLLTQLTDVAPRRPEPRLTDSQRFIRDEEEKLIDFVEKQKAEKKKAEDEQKKRPAADFRAPGPADGRRSDALARRHACLHRDRRARRSA